MDLYIYYKVKDSDVASLLAALVPMQASLAQHHGVACQLKRRPETKEGLQTWMEVYSSVPETFAAALHEAVAQAGVDQYTTGLRHTEVFMDVVPCA
jgi:thiaminase